jgi:hypothetical protein
MHTQRLALWTALAALLNAPLAWTQEGATAADTQREARSAEGFQTDRAPDALRDPATLLPSSSPPRRIARQSKGTGTQTLRSSAASSAWIYDATAEIYHDYDGDGYFHYLRVRFDADSYFNDHWVYARLYLSADGQYWDEYHVTQDFLINGTSPYDDYEVETELAAGYPPGLYDVLIELYDADYGDFLADFGPADSSALSLLPLEDLSYDGVAPPVTVTVSEEHGGGGAVDWYVIAALLACLLLQRAAQRFRSSTEQPFGDKR